MENKAMATATVIFTDSHNLFFNIGNMVVRIFY